MVKITELEKRKQIRSDNDLAQLPNYDWYLHAKENIKFYTMGDSIRAKAFLDAISDYEKKYVLN